MPQETASSLSFGEPAVVDGSVSERIRGMVGSEILKVATEIRRMVTEGRKICNLTVGDFDPKCFPIPGSLREGIHRALDAGETNYPPSNGLKSLREAVCEFVAQRWGARYPVDSVLIAGGARPILYAAYRCVLNRGDKVVYPVPSWNNNHYAWIAEAQAVALTTRSEDGFMPTLEQIEPHLATARLLCLNSPLNPAGTVIARDALRAIVDAVVEENRARSRQGRAHLFLLYDQVYGTLVFGGAEHVMPVSLVPEAAPWVINLDGISKSLAATGLRVGWVLAAPEMTSRMKDLIGHMGAWAPRPEQVALARYLTDTTAMREFEVVMNRRVEERLTALCRGVQRMKAEGYPLDCITPQGAIYLSLRLDLIGRTIAGQKLDSNEAVRRFLLERAGLAVIPFQAFGLPEDTGWFRLSVGAVSVEDIESGLTRLRKTLDGLEHR